jgi:hypothetical protein
MPRGTPGNDYRSTEIGSELVARNKHVKYSLEDKHYPKCVKPIGISDYPFYDVSGGAGSSAATLLSHSQLRLHGMEASCSL